MKVERVVQCHTTLLFTGKARGVAKLVHLSSHIPSRHGSAKSGAHVAKTDGMWFWARTELQTVNRESLTVCLAALGRRNGENHHGGGFEHKGGASSLPGGFSFAWRVSAAEGGAQPAAAAPGTAAGFGPVCGSFQENAGRGRKRRARVRPGHAAPIKTGRGPISGREHI